MATLCSLCEKAYSGHQEVPPVRLMFVTVPSLSSAAARSACACRQTLIIGEDAKYQFYLDNIKSYNHVAMFILCARKLRGSAGGTLLQLFYKISRIT